MSDKQDDPRQDPCPGDEIADWRIHHPGLKEYAATRRVLKVQDDRITWEHCGVIPSNKAANPGPSTTSLRAWRHWAKGGLVVSHGIRA